MMSVAGSPTLAVRPHKSRVEAFALLLGIALVFIAWGILSTPTVHGSLARGAGYLRRPNPAWVYTGHSRNSAVVPLWTVAGDSSSATFFIRYSGCHPTPTGTLRLAVYDTKPSAHARPFTNWIVEKGTSDSIAYGFTNEHGNTLYWLKVEVLSRRGCRWDWGQPTH